MIGKKTIVLAVVVGLLGMVAGGYAAESAAPQGSKMQQEKMYKGYTKDEHGKAFPAGHPAVNTLNRCYWDEEAGLYFCQFDKTGTGM